MEDTSETLLTLGMIHAHSIELIFHEVLEWLKLAANDIRECPIKRRKITSCCDLCIDAVIQLQISLRQAFKLGRQFVNSLNTSMIQGAVCIISIAKRIGKPLGRELHTCQALTS